MNPYLPLVENMAREISRGKEIPPGSVPIPSRVPCVEGTPKVLLFSPHPDDECITGALPLRLKREAGMNVLNVAVTLGSNKARRSERRQELAHACDFLGFELIETRRNGMENVNLKTRASCPNIWRDLVQVVAEILAREHPRIIFLPHSRDWNSTHIGTHQLVIDALEEMASDFSCTVIETEFWGAMDDPNLMVESSIPDVADLIAALAFHVKEVERSPYHLQLPAWMQDNVRRGGEMICGQGSNTPSFVFATLYRLATFTNGGLRQVVPKGTVVAEDEDLKTWLERTGHVLP